MEQDKDKVKAEVKVEAKDWDETAKSAPEPVVEDDVGEVKESKPLDTDGDASAPVEPEEEDAPDQAKVSDAGTKPAPDDEFHDRIKVKVKAEVKERDVVKGTPMDFTGDAPPEPEDLEKPEKAPKKPPIKTRHQNPCYKCAHWDESKALTENEGLCGIDHRFIHGSKTCAHFSMEEKYKNKNKG